MRWVMYSAYRNSFRSGRGLRDFLRYLRFYYIIYYG